jgi:tetratricopeptide (TPR) repeat protein
LAICFVACAGKTKVQPLESLEVETPKETIAFDRGLKALEGERYKEAADIFDRLLVQKPASELDLVTLYNSGAAYEGMGDCPKAATRYRELVRSFPGKFPRIEGQALFRLSLMYECMGQDKKAITALIDAKKRGLGLPAETLKAEIPARLAAAYARLGNRERALAYFKQASQGLKSVIASGGGRVERDLLGRTLFLMGQLNPAQRRADGDPGTFMQSLSMQQPYLLQAMELGHPTWSRRAAEDLNLAYDNFWKFKFEDSEKQRDFLVRGLQVVNELRKIRAPKSSEIVDDVYAHLDRTEKRLQAELAKVAETTKLTPEAERRQGLKRRGRLIDVPQPPPKKAPPKVKR